jgi:hypothetical protein
MKTKGVLYIKEIMAKLHFIDFGKKLNTLDIISLYKIRIHMSG